MTQLQESLRLSYKKAYYSVRRELYVFISFSKPMKLLTLIKMCLHVTYGKILRSKNLSDAFRIQNGQTGRWFVAITF
jgi:hypothetical protein